MLTEESDTQELTTEPTYHSNKGLIYQAADKLSDITDRISVVEISQFTIDYADYHRNNSHSQPTG